MKTLGYLLISGGFLAGAYLAVEQRDGVPTAMFLAALVVGAIGVAMVRVAAHQERTHADTISANLGVIEQSLASVVEKVGKLDDGKNEIDVYDLRHRIDEEFPDDLDAFVQARQSIVHSFGLQAYADVMNPFAAGERYLNRVWSTSADGYIDEAHTYVVKAREQFESALQVYRGLRRI
ncbi:MAG: hypothetical protein OEM62_04520 [Acidobacteriota bacterium]|nr:hypothetical protein [Acidobacteriota bacterium]